MYYRMLTLEPCGYTHVCNSLTALMLRGTMDSSGAVDFRVFLLHLCNCGGKVFSVIMIIIIFSCYLLVA